MQSFNSLCSNHITLPEEEEGWCANCGAWTTGGTWAISLGDLSFFCVCFTVKIAVELNSNTSCTSYLVSLSGVAQL